MSIKKSLKDIIYTAYGEMNFGRNLISVAVAGENFNDLLYTMFHDCTPNSRIKVLDTLGITRAPRYDVYAKGVKYFVVIPRYISVLDTEYTKAFLIGRSSKCGRYLVIKEIQINEKKRRLF